MNLRILALLPGALLAACAGAPEQKAPAAPREPVKAVYPSTYKAAVSPPTLIRGGTVLTGSGARLDGGDVLLADGRIAAVGRGIVAPPGARVIEAWGRWVTPGLIDTHSHIGPLPAVVSAQKGLKEPRYPTLKGIMGAKKKEVRDVKAPDLGLAAEPAALSVVALQTLPPRPPVRIISGEAAAAARELVRALREDAKAL